MKRKFQAPEFCFVGSDLDSDISGGCLPVSESLAFSIYMTDFEMSAYFNGCCNLL